MDVDENYNWNTEITAKWLQILATSKIKVNDFVILLLQTKPQ